MPFLRVLCIASGFSSDVYSFNDHLCMSDSSDVALLPIEDWNRGFRCECVSWVKGVSRTKECFRGRRRLAPCALCSKSCVCPSSPRCNSVRPRASIPTTRRWKTDVFCDSLHVKMVEDMTGYLLSLIQILALIYTQPDSSMCHVHIRFDDSISRK